MFAKHSPIRFATYLAPNMRPVYQCVTDYDDIRMMAAVAEEAGFPVLR